MDALLQYELVKSSREAVFQACLNLGDKYTAVPDGNILSICGLQVHISNVYQYWLLEISQSIKVPYDESVHGMDVQDVQAIFTEVDHRVENFCVTFKDSWTNEKSFRIPSRNISLLLTPLTIFTHTITHEFHHKGQMMKMLRQLGVVPPDTDIIRF